MTDELERLKRFWEAEPPPTRASTQSVRNQLTNLIENDSEPVRAHETPATTRRRVRHYDRHRRAWRRRSKRAVATVAVAGVAGALAIVVGTGSTSPSSAVAAVLQRLANLAAVQSPVGAPRAGQYLYVASLQAGESVEAGCTVLVPEQRQIWIGASGSGRTLDVPGAPSFFSAHEKLVCQRSHSAMLHAATTVSDTWWARGCYSLGDASYLHGSFQDPQALLRQMARIDGGPPGPAGAFMRVGFFLRESDASPALRAAIYRAAAAIPGVRLIGAVTDRLGRHGIGIALTSHGSTSELIFNPRNSSMLAEQTVNRAGQVIGWGVYRPTVMVNRIPGHPPGRLAPACTSGESFGHPGPDGTTIMTGAPSANP